jgi:hypothetical protein
MIYALAGGARKRQQNFGFSPCLLASSKSIVWGVEKANIIEPQPSVEESMAKTLNIDMCLTLRICEGQKRWRNQVLHGYLKSFIRTGY